MKATEEAASSAKAAAAAEEATLTLGVETASPAAGDTASGAAATNATQKAKAMAEARMAQAANGQQNVKRSHNHITSILDELDELNTNGVVDMGTVPGPPQVHVLEGDDIPTPGDALGTEVLIGGMLRQVIWAAGTKWSRGSRFSWSGGATTTTRRTRSS